MTTEDRPKSYCVKLAFAVFENFFVALGPVRSDADL
jgi:hypothetical protein